MATTMVRQSGRATPISNVEEGAEPILHLAVGRTGSDGKLPAHFFTTDWRPGEGNPQPNDDTRARATAVP